MSYIYTIHIGGASAPESRFDTSGPMSSIGEALRALRIAAGIKQVDLAVTLDIHQSTISGIENGRATTTDVVERWIDACGGTITIAPPGDRAAPLLSLAVGLDSADLDRAVRFASSLSRMPDDTKNALVLAAESIARSRG